MKNLIIIPVLMLLFTLNACDRNMEFETISKTDPELQVVVETVSGTTYTKIEGATVKIYKDKTTYDANGNPFITKNTNNKGVASFSPTELIQKGIFYIRVNKDALTGTGQTSYMLLNDGVTVVSIAIH